MKKVINGLLYDTDKAVILSIIKDFAYGWGDESKYLRKRIIYYTVNQRFFIHEIFFKKKWWFAKDYEEIIEERLILTTKKDVQCLLEEQNLFEDYENTFGDVEEA